MPLSDNVYNVLKHLVIYVIPALATFVGLVGVSVGWPQTAVAETIISGFGMFLASCIGMSVRAYEQAKKEEYDGRDE